MPRKVNNKNGAPPRNGKVRRVSTFLVALAVVVDGPIQLRLL